MCFHCVYQDMAHKGKEKDKGKSPVVSHSFDDPEGKIEMPGNLKVAAWKRPQEFITEVHIALTALV